METKLDKKPSLQVCNQCNLPKHPGAYGLLPSGNRRGTCHRCRSGKPPLITPAESKRYFRPLDSKVYIITAAQNATPVDEPFFNTLKTAAEYLNAELVVIPIRYKNPTSLWSKNQQNYEWWATEVVEYLYNVRKKLCQNLVLCGDIKVQPTASSPLTGFESLTGAESCIIGHPKMQFESVPVPRGRFPKILSTTGVCTKKNYTDTKAGKIGAFHHFLGALIVEIQGKKFHLRQINGDRQDGSFIDLDLKFSEDKVEQAPPALGLVMGDTHADYICPKVDKATFGPGGMVQVLNPQTLVFNDTIDNYAANPHHRGKPIIAVAKAASHTGDVEAEIKRCIEFLRSRTKGRKAVLVASNHDDFLARWIDGTDWRNDPRNAAFYLKTALPMVEAARVGREVTDPFKYWIDAAGLDNVKVLKTDESFCLADIECGLHGHQGPNGSFGTLKNLSRLGSKVISGHTHTPGIEEGHYQVGTSTALRLEYTKGPSSWLNTHCVVYANGKRALLTMIDGDWRLDYKR